MNNAQTPASRDPYTLETVWRELRAGVTSARHPFHTAALATVAEMEDGTLGAEVRTVVVRSADPATWTVSFHTDQRSPKHAQLHRYPTVSLLLYDAAGRWQVRLRGTATADTGNESARIRWETVRADSRACYRAPIAPSAPVTEPSRGDSDVTPAASDGDGFENFVAVTVAIHQIEALYLHHRGHRRILWERRAESIARTELAP